MRKITLILVGLCLLAAGPGYAKEKGKKKKPPPKQEKQIEPKILHVPAPEAPVSKAMILSAKIVAAWHFAKATVYYRRVGTREYKAATLERSSTGGYAATIPAKEVAPPGVEYYIASKDRKGKERQHFAGPNNPHQVVVRGKAETQKFRNYLARHKGNHSRARVPIGYSRSPTTSAWVTGACARRLKAACASPGRIWTPTRWTPGSTGASPSWTSASTT
jgi:hypothetical protein